MSGWPTCTQRDCYHRKMWDHWPPTEEEEREAQRLWLEGGKAMCACHRDQKPPKNKKRFPCPESADLPPTPEELAEVYKSLGVQEP